MPYSVPATATGSGPITDPFQPLAQGIAASTAFQKLYNATVQVNPVAAFLLGQELFKQPRNGGLSSFFDQWNANIALTAVSLDLNDSAEISQLLLDQNTGLTINSSGLIGNFDNSGLTLLLTVQGDAIAGTTKTLTATLAGAVGLVAQVRFQSGGEILGTDNDGEDDWTVQWTPETGGYLISAAALDGDGTVLAEDSTNIDITPPAAFTPSFTQALIDQATDANLMDWVGNSNLGAEYKSVVAPGQLDSNLATNDSPLYTAQAAYFMALVVYYDQDAVTTTSELVRDRLLEQLREVISGGKEPTCRGVLSGLADNALAQTFAMVRHTAAVWGALTPVEQSKITWLMQGLTAAGNYCQNNANDVRRGLYQTYPWRKIWNPNHQEGYVGVMIAASIFWGSPALSFSDGPATVNQMLANFDRSTWITQFNTFGFTNITGCWAQAFFNGIDLMQPPNNQPVASPGGGTTTGVKRPFTWEKQHQTGEVIAYDPFQLFEGLAFRMYPADLAVVAGGANGQAFTVGTDPNPFIGQLGMCYEFAAADGGGDRSSLDYVSAGLRNSIITRATLKAYGLWDQSSAGANVATRMAVGVGDFIHKAEQGYVSYENGDQEDEKGEAEFYKTGWHFLREIWEVFIQGQQGTPPPATFTLQNSQAYEQQTDGISVGDLVFADRTWTILALPPILTGLNGAIYIPGRKADGTINTVNWQTLTVNADCTVYVIGYNLHGWLSASGFVDTGEDVTTEAPGNATVGDVWERVLSAANSPLTLPSNGYNTPDTSQFGDTFGLVIVPT